MVRGARIAALGVLLPVLLAGCTIWAPARTTSWKNATGAQQFEELWWQSVKQQDWAEASSHMTATYVANLGAATYDREQTIAALHGLTINEFSLGDMKVQPNGNTVVITYTLNLQGSANGQPVDLQGAREMTIWQQQKRGWAAIAHAGSLGVGIGVGAGDPPGSASAVMH